MPQQQQLYPIRHDLPTDSRLTLVNLLNSTLSTTLDLKTQLKQAHWNVKGMEFNQLHLLFDEMATEVELFVDTLAERITSLGGVAYGTARVAALESLLPEYPLDAVNGEAHLSALADRYAILAKHLRVAIAQTTELDDADTADLYTGMSRDVDKRLWFLEAHLTN
ncbi:MAG: DNA starvation/stationary phase protection protein Dps [Pseudanabaenaceae cyanobacterium bins.68]|nr:DNA starvation/stationary phase protection protein Dps [Pseudanabaenaceae cyanobacterium bins.68]